jgi:deoxycytidylate deaminase
MRGPCAKQIVTCKLICSDGSEFIGENYCESAQQECPRKGMATGEGYDLCLSVCKQKGHAELVALEMAGSLAIGASAEISGHTYVCDKCRSALVSAGVTEITIK